MLRLSAVLRSRFRFATAPLRGTCFYPQPLGFGNAIRQKQKAKEYLFNFIIKLQLQQINLRFLEHKLTAYLALSFSHKTELQSVVNTIKAVLTTLNIKPIVFALENNYAVTNEKLMMQHALAEIDKCDLFIAELSYKSIGIGVEAGYAKAKNKPIVYLRSNIAEHSTTVSGISDYSIIYNSINDLNEKLKTCFNTFI